MMRDSSTSQVAPDEFVEFFAAGQSVKGEYHCSDCGYGVTIVRALPLCPMCGGTSWEQSAWSPFSRAPLL
jgi:rubrerythrin